MTGLESHQNFFQYTIVSGLIVITFVSPKGG